MQVHHDSITPGLAAIAARVRDLTPVAEAAGLQLVAFAGRSFNEPGVRAVPWAPLKPATIAEKIAAGKSTAILKRDVVMARSFRITDLRPMSVTVGTDRPYARYHQFGAPKRGLPQRPMLPFTGTTAASAQLAPWARKRLEAVSQKKLNALLQAASGGG